MAVALRRAVLSIASGLTVPWKVPTAAGTAAWVVDAWVPDGATSGAAGVRGELAGVPPSTGLALTVDFMLPCGPACVSASGTSGLPELASVAVVLVAVALDPVALPELVLDVVLGAGSPPDGEGCAVLGCVVPVGVVVSVGGGLAGVWGGGEGSDGAGVVVGGGVVVVVVGGGVAVVVVGGGVLGSGVGVGVGVATGAGTCATANATGAAIDALGANSIVVTNRRPAPAIVRIHRCARRLDMHVLKLIPWAPKFATDTSYVPAKVT